MKRFTVWIDELADLQVSLEHSLNEEAGVCVEIPFVNTVNLLEQLWVAKSERIGVKHAGKSFECFYLSGWTESLLNAQKHLRQVFSFVDTLDFFQCDGLSLAAALVLCVGHVVVMREENQSPVAYRCFVVLAASA